MFHGSPDEVLAMNVERKCVQKAVEFVVSAVALFSRQSFVSRDSRGPTTMQVTSFFTEF